ncbi:hypothetical protein N0V95_009686, partial [Ascochyta clinopodiicola]
EYACNLALCSQAVKSPQVGGFWKYVPGRNSGRWGCYVDEEGLGVAVPCVPTKPEVPMKPEVPAEQKVLGKLEQVVLSEPLAPTQGEIKTPLKNTADTHPAHRHNENKEIEIIDNGSYTAGEQLNTCASTPVIVVEKAKKQRAKLTKEQYRKSETIGDISNKVKKMLKKLCLGRRALKSLYRKPPSRPAPAKPSGSEEDDDGVIKWSMYPQVIGKRRSELARAQTRFMKSSQASTTSKGHEEYESHRCTVGSGLSYDSGYETESIMDDRPVQVYIYPQLKYCKVPGKMPAEPQQREPVRSSDNTLSSDPSSYTLSPRIPWNNTYRPGGLPHDEYRILVRRQKMQRVREMLEALFTPYGDRQRPRVWHGLKQPYSTRQTERRRISRVNYAVRKALRANFDLRNNTYELARYRHAGKIPYCDLSDVDGVPLPQAMIEEFTRAFRDAQDDAHVSESTLLQCGQPIQRAWVDGPAHSAAACRRVDSGIAMEESIKRPQLVSKFSWDSDSGHEVRKRRLLTKVRR